MSPGGWRGSGALLAAALLLSGCKDLGLIVGIASGSGSAAATGNPAVGFVVGASLSAGTNFVVHYVSRVRAGAEQDVIAKTAGALPVGGSAAWAIHHTIPIGNERGELYVTSEITTPIAVCKEVVFSVADSGAGRWYRVFACRDPKGWKWATAEPAVQRWGSLQ